MQSHRAIEILELHVSEWTDLDNAGVVDEDVDPAESLQRLLNGRLHLGRFKQIAGDGQDFGAEAVQIGFRVRKFICVSRKEHNFSAALANLSSDLQAEAARTASDERHFVAIELTRHSTNVERPIANVQF